MGSGAKALAAPTAGKERIRSRRGQYAAECKYCPCPDGCACSPEEPCPCGERKPAALTVAERRQVRSLIEDSGYTRAEAIAWVTTFGGDS